MTKSRLSFFGRVLLMFLPLALLIVGGSLIIYRTESRRLYSEFGERGREAVRINAAGLGRSLEDISRDLFYLASSQHMQLFLESSNPAYLSNLTLDWLAFAHTQQVYDQIRWVDETGRERLRVRYAKPWPLAVAPQDLRLRYAAEFAKLNPGEVFVSPMDLDSEGGVVEQPYKPIIRIGSPLFDSNGARRGVIVLNYAAEDMLRSFGKPAPGSRDTWLLNQDGYWLKGPDPEADWGFMWGRTDQTMGHRYPQAWQKISATSQGEFRTEEGLWNFATVYPLREVKYASANHREAFVASMSEAESARYAWKLVSLVPHAEYAARMLPFQRKLGTSTALLLGLLLFGSWRMARAGDIEQASRQHLEVVLDERTRDLAESQRLEAALHNSEMFARATIDALAAEICVLDSSGNIVAVNQSWRDFCAENGGATNAYLGENYIKVCDHSAAADDPQALEMARGLRDLINGLRQEFTMEYACDAPDRQRWFRVGVTRYEGEARQVVLAHEDITERKKAEQQLRLAATVYKALGEAIMVVDAGNCIVAVNPAFTQLTGYSEQDLVGRSARILRSERQTKEDFRAMRQQLERTGHWQGRVWNRYKNGEEVEKWLVINTIYDQRGKVQQRICMYSPISDQKLAEKTIWQQANFDGLTGLPNRRMFHDRLEQEIKRAHRAGSPLALMFIDLDHFKDVNDTLGHDKGDLLLKEAAKRLRSCVREGDTVARLGGDEFTVILSELDDVNSAERVAIDLLGKLVEPFSVGDEKAYISASIGITLYPQDATEISELLKNADQAMYVSKNQGRNRCTYFTSSMQEAAQNRMRMANDLRGALAAGQFHVAYQPIVDLRTGMIRKAEALLRWDHPRRGMVKPNDFISIAEETGMIIGISDWVFRQAAGQAAAWRASHDPRFQVSVNMSPVQFHSEASAHSSWFEQLKAISRGRNRKDMEIVVEITEGLLLDANATVTDRLLAFRDAGVQVSLDDFGTGYSSLSYLKKFDIDYLKIDQSFVVQLAADSDDLALCEAIIVMAHRLGLKVIAEGVETPEQCSLLAKAGCDFAQGFLFSGPVPAPEFEILLDRQDFRHMRFADAVPADDPEPLDEATNPGQGAAASSGPTLN